MRCFFLRVKNERNLSLWSLLSQIITHSLTRSLQRRKEDRTTSQPFCHSTCFCLSARVTLLNLPHLKKFKRNHTHVETKLSIDSANIHHVCDGDGDAGLIDDAFGENRFILFLLLLFVEKNEKNQSFFKQQNAGDSERFIHGYACRFQGKKRSNIIRLVGPARVIDGIVSFCF